MSAVNLLAEVWPPLLRGSAVVLVTASHDNHEKSNSWVSIIFFYRYGAPLLGPPELRYYLIIQYGITYFSDGSYPV